MLPGNRGNTWRRPTPVEMPTGLESVRETGCSSVRCYLVTPGEDPHLLKRLTDLESGKQGAAVLGVSWSHR